MRRITLLSSLLVLAIAVPLFAQTPITLPNTAQTTTLTANVSEQAQVTVPAGVTFNVTNVATSTASSGQTVTVDSIVLSSATKRLKVSLQSDAAAFTPSVVSGVTWSAGDVTWNAATWSNSGTAASGTLANGTYNTVVTCAADVTSCSTSNLTFTLGAKSSVNYSGNHTLIVRWKFESI